MAMGGALAPISNLVGFTAPSLQQFFGGFSPFLTTPAANSSLINNELFGASNQMVGINFGTGGTINTPSLIAAVGGGQISTSTGIPAPSLDQFFGGFSPFLRTPGANASLINNELFGSSNQLVPINFGNGALNLPPILGTIG